MSAVPPPAISVEGLTKDFLLSVRGYRVRAVDDLTLQVPAGQVFGLLGPNGSGKSTTIKVVLGLIEPTLGRTAIFGVRSAEVRSRLNVGYLPENPNFHRFLSGRELVTFYARVCGVDRARLRDRVDEVIEWVGLKDAASRRLSTYSKGMLQRIGLAQAVVHDPRLLILDEPTAGVDPVGSAEIGELILRLKAQGKTVVLSSHLLAQVEDLCDRIAILNRGRLVLEGGVDDLVTEKGRDALIVRGLDASALGDLRGWLDGRGAELVAVEKPRTTLDRIFREHVAERMQAADAPTAPGPGTEGRPR
ncbi:MAG: ABC transporter ATP-binding protein [Opitutaceae bacterium]|nr:ABC transporter ATP-binding protein [Opitutaceae bacterium]